jgi:hypothetical protein
MKSNSEMAYRLAKFVSTATSPYVIITFFAAATIARISSGLMQFFVMYGLFIILTIVPTVGWIYWKVRRGEITDMHVMVREHRSEPFLIATFGTIICTAIYAATGTSQSFVSLGAILALNGAVFWGLSRFVKVSIHAAAFTASTLIVAAFIDMRLLWLICLLPIVIWARTMRKKHSVWEGIFASCFIALLTILAFAAAGIPFKP